MDRWKQCWTQHYISPGEILGIARGTGILHRLENLNNINVNSWANSEIVHIIREQNTEMAWTLDSRKSHMQLPVFSEFHATVDYSSLERHSLGSVHSSCEKYPQK
jgi:hypothetical protein